MTHIVYFNGRLYVDTKSYRENGEVLRKRKLRTKRVGDEYWAWSFAGTYLECEVGNRVLESDFHPEEINRAERLLTDTNRDMFGGILVVSAKRNNLHFVRNVYLVNYFGDLVPVNEYNFLAVGAMSEAITGAFKCMQELAKQSVCTLDSLIPREEGKLHRGAIRWIMANATKDTLYQVDVRDIMELVLEGVEIGTANL